MSDETNVTTDDGTGQTEATPSAANAGKTFTQAEVDRIIAERLHRQKTAIEAQRFKEQAEAEQQKLAEQQQYKELADRYEQRVRELEPLTERVARYGEVVGKYLESERKGLPAPILALLDKMPDVDQLEWIAAHKSDVLKASKPGAPNINSGDKGSAPGQSERIKAYRESLLSDGQYGTF